MNSPVRQNVFPQISKQPHLLGYRYDEELQQYVIIPEEAEVVRLMFGLFLAGDSLQTICDKLNAKGYRTSLGNLFQEAAIAQLIQDELYVGDLCRQKSYERKKGAE